MPSPISHTLLHDSLLAYRPFLDPLDLHNHWLWLVVPLVLGIATVYKTLKLPKPINIATESIKLGSYILCIIALAGLTIHLLNELL